MFIHTFAFRWKPDVTDARRTEVMLAIRALQGEIPGLLATYLGTNVSPRAQGYALGGVMHFADAAAFAAYNAHPLHQALLSWLMPLIDALEVDFEVQGAP